MDTIHLLEARDRERCIDLALTVGWPREEKKWEIFLTLGRGFGSSDAQGALTSMVVVTPFEVGSFVAMMVVRPDTQGTGLGRRLLEHALADAQQPVMLYATPAGRVLYERIGFVVTDSVQKLGGTARATHASATTRRATAADVEAITAADRSAFGSGRGRHIAALYACASRCVVDDLGGFAIAWHNGAVLIVGPLAARDERAACDLIDAALEGHTGPARIDVPESSSYVAAHGRGLGLVELGEATPKMTWPHAANLGDPARYHAIMLQGLG